MNAQSLIKATNLSNLPTIINPIHLNYQPIKGFNSLLDLSLIKNDNIELKQLGKELMIFINGVKINLLLN